ncbi:Polyprenol reductase [Tolypocladium ophioglossoides CBS 100239]|uniref:Polyprenal reductase n=1 Tax=Tolypocladium ophioglossoides (strain CBS 100239) TaxID=1163406 RepID=A0A0L0NMC0_TOLOC|nr:Polyprenol reductase [Tolypocladium ophioglossoides CBS 100239]
MDSITAVPPALWCQGFFLGAAGGILALQVLPRDVRSTLMDYGARRPSDGSSSGGQKKTKAALLTSLASYGQVPHSWFWHFYVLSVSWSAFWAWQYVQRGAVMAALAEAQARSTAASPSMELGRVFLAWTMLAVQGSRRLYECFFVTKPGHTPMLFVHWALALAFYTALNISVWIEGSGTILESWKSQQPTVLLTSRVPSALAIFFAAWVKQNECHRYLAGLKKYTFPSGGVFSYLVCPHYTCECVIYLAISFMAAPPGSLLNTSVLCGLAFVAVNLGATAHGTKQWYAQKFGAEQVAGRWRMIPFVF